MGVFKDLVLRQNQGNSPGRNPGFVVSLVQNKSSIVGRFFCRKDAVSIGKVDQSPQIRQFFGADQLLYMGKDRSKVGAAKTLQFHGLQVVVKLFLTGDTGILPDPIITLENVQIDFRKKALLLQQDIVGMLDKGLDYITSVQ